MTYDRRLHMTPDIGQVIIRYVQDQQPMENVFYVSHEHTTDGGTTWNTSNFDSGSADNVASDVASWLGTSWAPIASNSAAAVGTQVVWNQAVPTGPLQGNAYTGSPYPIPNTGGNDPFPNSVTVAISGKTKLLGRAFHGRIYFVGLGKNSVDTSAPNALNSSGASSIITAYEALRTALKADHGVALILDRYPMMIGSFKSAGVDRTTGLFTEIDHFALSDNYLDNQRRRLPAHNRHR